MITKEFKKAKCVFTTGFDKKVSFKAGSVVRLATLKKSSFEEELTSTCDLDLGSGFWDRSVRTRLQLTPPAPPGRGQGWPTLGIKKQTLVFFCGNMSIITLPK